MSILSADHLLDQASRLISTSSGGTPRQADLRRAISNAYYAIFHAIVTAMVDDVVGRGRRASVRYALLYRSVDHRKLKDLCREMVKQAPSERLAKFFPAGGFGSDLKTMAEAVISLQEKREQADYDP